MSPTVVKTCSSTVARSRWERNFKALSKKSRLRATAAVAHCWTGRTVCPTGDGGQTAGFKLRLDDDSDDRATEGVGDVGFEGIGLAIECEEGSVWLVIAGEEWEKGLRRRCSRSRHFAGVVAPVIVALLRKKDLCQNDNLEVVEPGDAKEAAEIVPANCPATERSSGSAGCISHGSTILQALLPVNILLRSEDGCGIHMGPRAMPRLRARPM
jgi:hypothetical protein